MELSKKEIKVLKYLLDHVNPVRFVLDEDVGVMFRNQEFKDVLSILKSKGLVDYGYSSDELEYVYIENISLVKEYVDTYTMKKVYTKVVKPVVKIAIDKIL